MQKPDAVKEAMLDLTLFKVTQRYAGDEEAINRYIIARSWEDALNVALHLDEDMPSSEQGRLISLEDIITGIHISEEASQKVVLAIEGK